MSELVHNTETAQQASALGWPRLVGTVVRHVPSGETRRVCGYKTRRYGIVLQLAHVIKHRGDTLYMVLAADCEIAR